MDLTCRLCSQVNDPSQYLPYIIPTITQRLGGEEIVESTEEIRLKLMEILSKLCTLCEGETTGVYINELVQVSTVFKKLITGLFFCPRVKYEV